MILKDIIFKQKVNKKNENQVLCPLIQIVIIYKKIDNFVFESVSGCLKLNYEEDFIIKDKRINVIKTGTVSIPVKRNIVIYNSHEDAEFIAFLDADAYPDPNWLINCIQYFNKKDIVEVLQKYSERQ